MVRNQVCRDAHAADCPIKALLFVALLCLASAAADTDWQWRHYGADAASTKFAPISQIDSTNFDQLRMIWRWRSPDAEYSELEGAEYGPTVNQNTPLVSVSIWSWQPCCWKPAPIPTTATAGSCGKLW